MRGVLLIALAACSSPNTSPVLQGASTVQAASASQTTTSPPSPPPAKHYEPTYGPPRDQLVDLDWIDPQRGLSLVGKACGNAHGPCAAVYGTENGGRTWSRLSSAGSLACGSVSLCVDRLLFVTPRIGYLYGPALFVTTDGGRTWTHAASPPVESLVSSGGELFRLVYHGTGCPGPCNPSLQRSEPGGRTWSTLRSWSWPDAPGFGEQLLAGHRNLYVIFYGHIAGGAGLAHAVIDVSHDAGQTWSVRSDPCGYADHPEEDASAAAAAGDSLGILCVSRDGRGPNFTALSRDAGGTFAASTPLSIDAPEQITVDDEGGIAVGNGGISGGGKFEYELALSDDGGRTWGIAIHDRETVGEDLARGSLQFITPQDLSWVGYPYYVWQSFDAGRSWRETPAP